MNKKLLYFLISFLFFSLIFPASGSADRGMMAWPPEIHLDQSAQNAIVAWNGSEEIIILSSNIQSSNEATVLEILPLPSEPSKVEEGSFESFEKLTELINEKQKSRADVLSQGKGELLSPEGVEIVFHEQIGAHDVTIVKVDDLDEFIEWIKNFANDRGLETKELSESFKDGLASYFKRGIKYFVFDVVEAGEDEESIEPLIYRFDSDFLYYPILISGISEIEESMSEINLFLITEKELEFPLSPFSYRAGWFNDYGYPVLLSKSEIEEVSQQVASLFDGEVQARKTSFYGKLNGITRDLMLFPKTDWQNVSLGLGSFGDEVRTLQRLMINEGVWESDVEATGYFGPITKTALKRFQEKYSREILEPLELESGTGYFGSKTKEYLNNISVSGESASGEKESKLTFTRSLSLGMRGDDVKALQEVLIKEGVWESATDATGYFGPITKAAVVRYQEKHASEILEPLGLKKGTGYFGSSSCSYLNKQNQEKDLTYCEKDEDCILVEGCCGCNEGGRGSCINGNYVDKWNAELDCENVVCMQVYLCDEPSLNCKCVDNVCKGF